MDEEQLQSELARATTNFNEAMDVIDSALDYIWTHKECDAKELVRILQGGAL